MRRVAVTLAVLVLAALGVGGLFLILLPAIVCEVAGSYMGFGAAALAAVQGCPFVVGVLGDPVEVDSGGSFGLTVSNLAGGRVVDAHVILTGPRDTGEYKFQAHESGGN